MIGLLERTLARLQRGESSPLPSEQGPPWPESAPLSVEDLRATFDEVEPRTIGVEEELLLVSERTLDLEPANQAVLERLEGDPRFHPELRAAQLEIVTPVCRSAGEIGRELSAARARLIEAARADCSVLAAGTHPFSLDWGEISEADRYRLIEDEYAWASRRSLACGLHVHVAVGGADRTLAVFNAFRSYLPEIAAVCANSPYLYGEDTGLCSVRPRLIGSLPRTGVPPAFAAWDELAGLVGWARTGGLYPDASFLWWDLRPHVKHGTIELRAADVQTDVDDAAAVAALVHCLVTHLANRFSEGERLPVHDGSRIAENAWRAVRYGVSGELVDLDTGRREPARERIARLLDVLEPAAAALDCREELLSVRALLAGTGADRQRYVAAREGMVGLAAWLVQQTERSADQRSL